MAALDARGDGSHYPVLFCEVTAEVVGVSGAGVMLMSGDVLYGSLCTTNSVSQVIEELQYTMGEGPCVDAYGSDKVVSEPDLANPSRPRWPAFGPRAVAAGVRGVFGFPLREGAARLGALHLYQDRPGPLTDGQHADALVMAELIARWVLDEQAASPPDSLAVGLEAGSEFHFVVHNAAGMTAVQLGISVTEALIRLRAYAFGENRLVQDVALDVVARRLRIS